MEIVLQTKGHTSVVGLEGRLDAHQSKQVIQKLSEAVSTTSHVVVNLSKVNFIDSTGLATLVKEMRHSREKDGDLVLCELQQPVRIIFELTRLDCAFHIYTSEKAALEAVQ